MLTEFIRECTDFITPLFNDFLVEIGVGASIASPFSSLLVGLVNSCLVLLVVIVPFIVLSFVIKLIWRLTNDLYN